jgi:hypothetical protein
MTIVSAVATLPLAQHRGVTQVEQSQRHRERKQWPVPQKYLPALRCIGIVRFVTVDEPARRVVVNRVGRDRKD